jgi:hypothetical protein
MIGTNASSAVGDGDRPASADTKACVRSLSSPIPPRYAYFLNKGGAAELNLPVCVVYAWGNKQSISIDQLRDHEPD